MTEVWMSGPRRWKAVQRVLGRGHCINMSSVVQRRESNKEMKKKKKSKMKQKTNRRSKTIETEWNKENIHRRFPFLNRLRRADLVKSRVHAASMSLLPFRSQLFRCFNLAWVLCLSKSVLLLSALALNDTAYGNGSQGCSAEDCNSDEDTSFSTFGKLLPVLCERLGGSLFDLVLIEWLAPVLVDRY